MWKMKSKTGLDEGHVIAVVNMVYDILTVSFISIAFFILFIFDPEIFQTSFTILTICNIYSSRC